MNQEVQDSGTVVAIELTVNEIERIISRLYDSSDGMDDEDTMVTLAAALPGGYSGLKVTRAGTVLA